MSAAREKTLVFLDRHRRALLAAALVWTALSAYAFELLWIFYEPYSLTFYLEGRGSFADLPPEEVPQYIRFTVFVVVMTLSTVFPVAAALLARYILRKR